jgi:hypothetical protein
MIIIEMTKRSMTTVMEEGRYPEKGVEQGGRKYAGKAFIKARIKMTRKSPSDMHRP